ncbi:hypothetical protein ACFOMD_00400 [Sphingoaurantiacus capsulatus]|uniref:Lipoprotein n=1 Tax=Sphingoaurantiacus capsulatus TaxID=1771310 RepID=A0ABV7X6X0_9SPHN
MMLALLAAAAACPSLPGIGPVLTPATNYVLVGEYHGTVEMPAVAADVACAAAITGRPVIFGVEFTPDSQSALDAFMASDGGTAARSSLLAAPAWREPGGRTTAAILDMLESVRRLGKARTVKLIAFDTAPTPTGTSPEREAAMAVALSAARAKQPDAIVVALTGAGHADKEGFTSAKPPFLAAAGRLPAAETVSLSFMRPGGQFWGCASPTGDASGGCKAYDMPPREPVVPRGITLDPKLRGGFDGLYSVGGSYTASKPPSAPGTAAR